MFTMNRNIRNASRETENINDNQMEILELKNITSKQKYSHGLKSGMKIIE